jgi:excisionase family DNA binding protein
MKEQENPVFVMIASSKVDEMLNRLSAIESAIAQISPADEKPLTRAQAAKALGIGLNTLAKLVESGKITPARAGNRQLFHVSEIKRFLTSI